MQKEIIQALSTITEKKDLLTSMLPMQKTKEDIFKFMYPYLKIEEHENLLCCFEHLLVDANKYINEKILAYDLEFQNLIISYAENSNK